MTDDDLVKQFTDDVLESLETTITFDNVRDVSVNGLFLFGNNVTVGNGITIQFTTSGTWRLV